MSGDSCFSGCIVDGDQALPLPNGQRGVRVEVEALGLDLAVCLVMMRFFCC